MNQRYFLDTDQSGHWYVVPCDHEDDWSEWRDLPEDDKRSWEAPEWATRVGGAPSLVTFENFTL